MIESRHPVVLVLGCHRSGTSLVARVVNLLGVATDPADDLMAPGPDNERGYWEPRYLAEMNDELLAASGGSWCAPPLETIVRPSSESDLLGRMRDRVRRRVETGRSWVWKDPRMTITCPAWFDLLPPVLMLVCVRNPLDVWNSLYDRDRFPKAASYLLWEIYTRAALAHARRLPCRLVHYERLLAEPVTEVQALAGFLAAHGVLGDETEAGEAVAECRQDLRHHSHRPEAFLDDDAAADAQKDLYRTLLASDPSCPPQIASGLSVAPAVARELLLLLEAIAEARQRRELEHERFRVLDGKLGMEINLAKERFDVLDGKLGGMQWLQESQFQVLESRLTALDQRIEALNRSQEELRKRAAEAERRKPSWQAAFGRWKISRAPPPTSSSPTEGLAPDQPAADTSAGDGSPSPAP